MVALLTRAEKGLKKETLTPADSGGGIEPFGRIFTSTGAFKDTNKWRFSTKQAEDDWGLYYYGYRYYQPDTSRWLSRDPRGRTFLLKPFTFVNNNPLLFIDAVGREDQVPSGFGDPGNPMAGPAGYDPLILKPIEDQVQAISEAADAAGSSSTPPPAVSTTGGCEEYGGKVWPLDTIMYGGVDWVSCRCECDWWPWERSGCRKVTCNIWCREFWPSLGGDPRPKTEDVEKGECLCPCPEGTEVLKWYEGGTCD